MDSNGMFREDRQDNDDIVGSLPLNHMSSDHEGANIDLEPSMRQEGPRDSAWPCIYISMLLQLGPQDPNFLRSIHLGWISCPGI